MNKPAVFISYASEDAGIARRLCHDLNTSNIRTWFDREDLLPGENWRQVIPRKIRESDYFLLLVSRHSVNKRGYIQKEQRTAMDIMEELPSSDIFIVPARIDGTEPMDERLERIHWADLSDYGRGLQQLIRVFTVDKSTPGTGYGNQVNTIVGAEFIEAQNFDLEEMENTFLDHLEGPGLYGFRFYCESNDLIGHLCARLEEADFRLRGNITKAGPYRYRPGTNGILHIFKKLGQIPVPPSENVVVRIEVKTPEQAEGLWNDLRLRQNQPMNHYIIVLMAILPPKSGRTGDTAGAPANEPEASGPGGMVDLGTARFRPSHLKRWIDDVIRNQGLSPDIYSEWYELVLSTCRYGNTLVTGEVYNHISDVLSFIGKRKTQEEFQNWIKDMRECYEQCE